MFPVRGTSGLRGRAGARHGLGKKLQYHGSFSVEGVSEEVRCVGFCARWGPLELPELPIPPSI